MIGDATVATFAAFGSFAMLLLVDFAGPMRARLQAQVALAVAVRRADRDRHAVLAHHRRGRRGAMTVVAFGVLFAGVVSSVLAGRDDDAAARVHPPGHAARPGLADPRRLAGWGLASLASLPAIALLWPAPAQDPLRAAAIAAMRALAGRDSRPARRAERRRGRSSALRRVFFATPYRPTGLSTAARAVIRLVDELKWLNDMAIDTARPARGADPRPVLERGADLLEDPHRSPEALHAAQHGAGRAARGGRATRPASRRWTPASARRRSATSSPRSRATPTSRPPPTGAAGRSSCSAAGPPAS